MSVLGVATLTTAVDLSGLDKGLGQAKGKSEGFFGSLAKLGGGLITAGIAAVTTGIVALGAGLAYSIGEAMEAQEVQAQLAAVLESTGGAAGVTADMATDLADSLSEVTRFGDEAILSGENMLLTFTNIGAEVFPMATQAMLDLSQATGQDLQSSAVQLGKALNDPIAGITALTRVGVTFTDEQKKMIESLVASGDVMGAQTLILEELNKEFGGSAVAAGETFAGQLDILKNSLSNVAEGIGMALLPMLTDLTGFVTANVLPWIQGVGEELGRLLGIFADVGWGDFFTTFEDGSSYVSSFFQALGFGEETANKIGTAINSLAQWLGGFSEWLATDGKQAWDDFLLALEPVKNVAIALVTAFIENLPKMQELLMSFSEWLAGDGKSAWDGFLLSIQPLVDAIVTLSDTIIIDFPLMKEKAMEFVNWAVVSFGPPIATMIDNLKQSFKLLVGETSGNLGQMTAFWTEHKGQIMQIIGTAMQFVTVTIGGALLLASGILKGGLQILQGDWEGAWETMKKTLESFLNLALSIVGTNLEEFKATWSGTFDLIKIAWDTFWSNFYESWSGNWELAGTIIDTLKGNIETAFTGIKTAIQGVIDKVAALIAKFSGLKVPDILTPGSPTPFEIGLRGIGAALDDLSARSLPAFDAGLASIAPPPMIFEPIVSSSNEIDKVRARIGELLNMPLDEGLSNELNGLTMQLENLTHGAGMTGIGEMTARGGMTLNVPDSFSLGSLAGGMEDGSVQYYFDFSGVTIQDEATLERWIDDAFKRRGISADQRGRTR